MPLQSPRLGSEGLDSQTRPTTTRRRARPSGRRVDTLRRLRWALVPLLAIVAYGPVLGIGFLAEDWLYLTIARHDPVTIQSVLPSPYWFFYRPLGMAVTWLLGWQLWGLNPVPYHLLGLLLHAGASLWLGLASAEIGGRRSLGLLAGALFAVFPLHVEAVGWLSAQWDAWAAFFGLLSLWLFSRWWRRREAPAEAIRRSGVAARDEDPGQGAEAPNDEPASDGPVTSPGTREPTADGFNMSGLRIYLASVAAYAAGIFSKESLITFLPVLALAAWMITPRAGLSRRLRLLIALTPFAAAMAANLGLRYARWGNIGGYQGSSLRVEQLWDAVLTDLRPLLAPVNAEVLGAGAAQITGLAAMAALLLGLAWHGRAQRRMLLFAGAWTALALLPVLGLGIRVADLSNSRFFYLASAAYCLLLATLLLSTLAAAGPRRGVVAAGVALLLVLSTGAAWANLDPWRTATAQVEDLQQELERLIPPQPKEYGWIWYVEQIPDSYKGALLLRLGLGNMRGMTTGDPAGIEPVPDAAAVSPASSPIDAFALRFAYYEQEERFHVDYASGITSHIEPPLHANANADANGNANAVSNFRLWDFRRCDSGVVASWQVRGARAECVDRQGLLMRAETADPLLQNADLVLETGAPETRFVRLLVAVSYGPGADPASFGEWFWFSREGDTFVAEQSTQLQVKPDGRPHVYWTFVPVAQVGAMIRGLRFDPLNVRADATIHWIAVDMVK